MTASDQPGTTTPGGHGPERLRDRLHDDPAGLLVDLCVHVPVGLALSTRDLLPQLIDRGRRRVGQQVTTARMIGAFVVPMARRKGEAYLRSRLQPAVETGAPAAEHPAGKPTPTPAAAGVVVGADRVLPIEDYDTLPASAVVALLSGLDAAERASVAAHERSHRARRTILARLEQLDAAAEGS